MHFTPTKRWLFHILVICLIESPRHFRCRARDKNKAEKALVWSCLFSYLCNAQGGSKRFILDSTYHWGQWSSYSQCNDCLKGTKSRDRYCYDGNNNHVHGSFCGGYELEFTQCYQSDCRSDCTDVTTQCQAEYCVYSDWAKTNCRKTCGFCSAGVYQAVDGGWSNWSSFSQCSVTCGQGIITRYRTCTNPSPSNGGKPCPFHSQETYQCSKPACIVNIDGGWSSWSYWSICSTSCDLGVISRDRTCTNPAPSGNGASCSGNHTEIHECSDGPCAEWSHWFEGDCSTSCGNGTMERLRHCSTGRDTDCPGVAYEMVPCSNVECV